MLVNAKVVLSNVKRCYPIEEMCYTLQQKWYPTRKTGLEKLSLQKKKIKVSKILEYREFFCIFGSLIPLLSCPFWVILG